MKKLLIAMVLLWPFAAAHEASAASEKIQAVSSAGISCNGALPSRITQRFVNHAKRACEGRVRCSVRATQAAGARRLTRYACTDFYVVARCGFVNREFRSKGIKKRLRVSC